MNDSQPQIRSSGDPESSPDPKKFFHFWRCFWLAFLVVSLAYAGYSFYVPSSSAVAWADDYTVAQQQAAQAGKPMILFFTARWCVPCRIMKRNVWADRQVAAAVNEAFIPVMIDMDDPISAPAISQYRVGATPSTVFTDPQGNVLQQRQGGMGKAEFLELLRESSPTVARVP